jgi:hypothetical protein
MSPDAFLRRRMMGQRVKMGPPSGPERPPPTPSHINHTTSHQGRDKTLVAGHHTDTGAPLRAPQRATGVVPVSAVPPPPPAAPHAFRDSGAGRVWQERHFAAVLDLLGPHPDAVTLDRVRAHLASQASDVPAVELEAFVQEMAWGARVRQALLTRLVGAAPPPHVALHDHQASLGVLLTSQLEATLVPLHETLQQCFVASFRTRVGH